MNFWKRFPGDYACYTAHLSLAEHGAFTLLLDNYYGTGRPLPGAIAALHRLCRATSKTERDAVEHVAEEFFPLCEDGFRHNERADKDLVEYNQRVDFNRRVGSLGGRPKRTTENPNANPNGIPDANPNANPDANPEETLLKKLEARSKKLEEERKARPPGAPRAHPSIQDVQSYCAARGNAVNPQRFVDYYTANGWRVGKNPMRDWQAAVRTWEKNGVEAGGQAVAVRERACSRCGATGSLVEAGEGPLCMPCYRS